MPQKNSIKTYVEGGIYHVYNRGVEKRQIYEDEADYKVFLNYLKEYLSPPPDPVEIKREFTLQGASFKGIPRQPINYLGRIELIAFCLMPNHFHLLLRQFGKDDMQGFMRSLSTRYSMYFNKKYNRIGKLFQGHYKAAFVPTDEYLLHLSRYIHCNPSKHLKDLTKAYSSYSYYLGLNNANWIKPQSVLKFFDKNKSTVFNNTNDYKSFVENNGQASDELPEEMTLE